jgi:hypothetical protein
MRGTTYLFVTARFCGWSSAPAVSQRRSCVSSCRFYAASWIRTSENAPSETVWKLSATSQPPNHQANHGRVDERFRACAQPLVVFAHPPVLAQPREGALDGLLANDKFCMIRHARLSLSHSRRPNLTHRQTDVATAGSAYPPAGITRHGGDDETSVAPTSGSDGTPGCEAALGSGVPGHPAVEPRKRASSCSEGEQRGGVP